MTEKEKNRLASGIKEVARDCDLFKKDFKIEIRSFNDGTLMSWTEGGTLSVSTTIQKINDGTEVCAARDLRNALKKLSNKEPMSFVEEYMIETLYHENVHSRAVGLPIREKSILDTVIEETCTQLYAREKYVNVLKKYGRAPEHFYDIRHNGLGYREQCEKLRAYFTKNGEIQVGELINIANGSSKGGDILLGKLIKLGMSEREANIFLSNFITASF